MTNKEKLLALAKTVRLDGRAYLEMARSFLSQAEYIAGGADQDEKLRVLHVAVIEEECPDLAERAYGEKLRLEAGGAN
jgi:hypothetical protein